MRLAAVDVHYPPQGGARAALVLGDDRRFTAIVDERVCWLPDVAPYQPGSFFARELPALRAVLADAGSLDLVLIDGYVDLDPGGRPGLGAHLHARIHTPVIGVAKTAFRTATHAIAVHRGKATRPLYVTAAGFPVGDAAALVAQLAGPHRLPDALRRVDALALLAVSAAVEDEQMERAGVAKIAPVPNTDLDCGVVTEQTSSGGSPIRLAFDADEPGPGMRSGGEPGEADSVSGSGLADYRRSHSAGQDSQQLTLFGQAGVWEPGGSGQLDGGRDHGR